jgi:hypothetical protein
MLLTEGFSSHYKSNQYDKQGFVMIKTSRFFNGTKTSLTTVEEILKQLAKVVDGLTGIFEGEQDLARKLKTVLDLVVVVTFFDIRKW